MKTIVRFRPNMDLPNILFRVIAFAGKLVFMDRFEVRDALAKSCRYYKVDFIEELVTLYIKLANCFEYVEVPNRLKPCQYSEYLRKRNKY